MTDTPGPEEHQLLHDEQTIEEWWSKNGLDHIAARIRRKETYLQQLKEAAAIMDTYKNAHPTKDQN